MHQLAPYAANPVQSKGRLYPEPDPEFRTQFQRDRDRVIHSSAFRRLEYKTQVFVNHEGDMFRTRLTHSIEVAQIGRTIARALRVNEDLVEAICLAHDLGHTPFGHAGQHALNECMKDFGGFEHNLQSLRVVDVLEEKYADFPGLNLTYETREGILKHCSRGRASGLGELGRRFLEDTLPGLEAQIANIADEIAYNNHDVDDGLRAGLISIERLTECEIIRERWIAVSRLWPKLPQRRLINELIRRMIDYLVSDVVRTSRAKIEAARPGSIDDVRSAGRELILLGDAARSQHQELKHFLNLNLYQHYRVQRMSYKAERVVKELFAVFMDNARLLPDSVQERIRNSQEASAGAHCARMIADYIAGMTDRYAIAEFDRLRDPRESGN